MSGTQNGNFRTCASRSLIRHKISELGRRVASLRVEPHLGVLMPIAGLFELHALMARVLALLSLQHPMAMGDRNAQRENLSHFLSRFQAHGQQSDVFAEAYASLQFEECCREQTHIFCQRYDLKMARLKEARCEAQWLLTMFCNCFHREPPPVPRSEDLQHFWPLLVGFLLVGFGDNLVRPRGETQLPLNLKTDWGKPRASKPSLLDTTWWSPSSVV